MSEIENLYRSLQKIRVYKLACQELALLSAAYTNATTQRQRNVLIQTTSESVTQMENSIKQQILQLTHTNRIE